MLLKAIVFAMINICLTSREVRVQKIAEQRHHSLSMVIVTNFKHTSSFSLISKGLPRSFPWDQES